MLNAYLSQVQALLQQPTAPTSLYPTATLTQAINTARSQIAGEGQCIRANVLLTPTIGVQSYPFSAFTALPSGVAGALNVHQVGLVSGSTYSYLDTWPWEWFFRYYLAAAAPPSGTPTIWAQQGQGVSGTIFLYPVPISGSLTVSLDCTLYPIPLVTDSTAEAIPYPWTDCVQYLAAYLALLGAQSTARQGDADRMFARYTEFSVRARNMSTATVLPVIYQRSGIVPPGVAASAAQQQRAG